MRATMSQKDIMTITPSKDEKGRCTTTNTGHHEQQQQQETSKGALGGVYRRTHSVEHSRGTGTNPSPSTRTSTKRRSTTDIAALKALILGEDYDDTITIANNIVDGELLDDGTVATVLCSFPSQGSSSTASNNKSPVSQPPQGPVRHWTNAADIAYMEALALGEDENEEIHQDEQEEEVVECDEESTEPSRLVSSHSTTQRGGRTGWAALNGGTSMPLLLDGSGVNERNQLEGNHEEENMHQNLTEAEDAEHTSFTTVPSSASQASGVAVDSSDGQQQNHSSTHGNNDSGGITTDNTGEHPDEQPRQPDTGDDDWTETATVVLDVPTFALTDEDDRTSFFVTRCCCSLDKQNWVVRVALVTLLIGGIAIAIRILIGGTGSRTKEGSSDTLPKENNRTWDSDSRLTELLDLFELVSSPMVFLDPLSPQSQALDWLVYEDKLLQSIADPNLLQRYALLVLAFATDGQNWRAIDSWDEQYNNHECTFQGLDCNGNNEVVHMDLTLRRLTGFLPDEIGLLTALTGLELARNNLEGAMPEKLYQCTNLVGLDISMNDISSTISPYIARLTQLEYLFISRTLLTGTLPDSMMQLTSLSHFVAFGSLFEGPAIDFALSWPKLELFDIGVSNMHGTLTSELGKLTNMRLLYLVADRIEGELFTELGRMTDLEILNIESDKVNGSIPSEIGNLSKLYKTGIKGAYMTGVIPSEIGHLTELQFLNFGLSSYSGTLPTELGRLTKLEELIVQSNQLTGTIPSQLSEMSNLETLLLKTNRFEGSIPSELCERGIHLSRDCAVDCECCVDVCADN